MIDPVTGWLGIQRNQNKEAINIANLVEEHGLPDIHGLWN